MESGIFKYILRYSKGQQLYLLLITMISFPFLYFSLEVPKIIINEAIGGKSGFPQSYFGIEFEQTPFLMTLCGIFLIMVFVNGGFKFYINVYRGVIAERMLRRLRFQLIHRVLRFPLPHFRSISSGEIVSMVATETEPLGGFFGDAFSLVSFQGGTLLTLLFFMFVQDWKLGLAAIALYPVQAYVIPKLQRQVNLLGKERVQNVRKLSERLGELVTGVTDIHAHDTAQYEMADFASRLGAIYQIRFQIYRKKFFIKFINNFLALLTPFFFYSIGGYLVISGDLTLGALVAILAAYKDVSAPWKELLAYYQRMEDARIKYDQLAERFQPAGMIEEKLLEPHEGPVEELAGALVASNVSLEEEEGTKTVESATFSFDTSEHVALVGSAGGGADGIARLLARLVSPTSGQITVEGKRFSNMPESVTGRRIAYVDQESYIRSGTIKDTLLYGLKHYPGESPGEENGAWKNEQEEALKAGNSPFNVRADWIDYTTIGAEGPDDLNDRMIQTLVAVGLEDDVFQLGLRRVVDPAAYPALADSVLQARGVVREKLSDPVLGELVETFDIEKFNTNASVAENILFGTPVGETFNIEDLGKNPYVIEVLEKSDLTEEFLETGRAIAAIMVELFHDLPPGHEFFEQFSFIEADDLPEFQRILNHVEKLGIENIAQEDRDLLNQLPFKLVPARHRLGMIEDDMRKRILETRRTFSQNLPENLRDAVNFFDAGAYNAASNIQDNILFGKVAGGKAESASRIGELLAEVIEGVGLRRTIIEAGLDFEVGISGKRLSPAQRQKLAIARVLIKRPQMTIVNEATAALDASTQAAVFSSIKDLTRESGLVWVENEIGDGHQFDRILVENHGRVTEQKKDAAAKPPPEEAPAPAPAEDGGDLGQEVGLLAKIPLFAGMERSKLKLLAFTSERQDFEEGQILFKQGDPGDRAFVIVEGAVDVIVDTPDGPQVLSNPGRGDVIGELALLCEEPRTATVKANQPLTVLSISGEVFFKLIHENPDVSVALTRIVAKRLVQTMKQMG